MRTGVLSQGSDLIERVGWEDDQMEVKYWSDHKSFLYFNVPFKVFKSIVRSKNPGTLWLSIRDDYKFEEV